MSADTMLVFCVGCRKWLDVEPGVMWLATAEGRLCPACAKSPPRLTLPPPNPEHASYLHPRGRPLRCLFGLHDWRLRDGGPRRLNFVQCRRCDKTSRDTSLVPPKPWPAPLPLPWRDGE